MSTTEIRARLHYVGVLALEDAVISVADSVPRDTSRRPGMTTAAKRARQKQNRADHGRHTMADHNWIDDPEHPGHTISERCLICRPLPMSDQQRLAHRVRLATEKMEIRFAHLPTGPIMSRIPAGIPGVARGAQKRMRGFFRTSNRNT